MGNFKLKLVAYFEGRSIVRALGSLTRAAERGRVDELGEQLEARRRELERERRRLRETTLRFGEALAATHDVEQLRRAMFDTAIEATGATGAVLVADEVELLRIGTFDPADETIHVPLVAAGEDFGLLTLHAPSFDDDERETAIWLVAHGVIALENARRHRDAERQALVDGLTALANRRLCVAALGKELARAERFTEPLALVIADLDDFKAINDRYGHPTGDDVLRQFATTLRQNVRDIDVAGRWGGEEFVLILPRTDAAGAKKLVERIRGAVAKVTVAAPGGDSLRVTASFGIASFPAYRGEADIVAAADMALYDAKRRGKNRVSVAFESARTSVPSRAASG